ncbi:glycine oxidase ThiO [Bacillus gobiensis]|uniref:glycine oxidase ThiO n=1 Tax=Bacillus gobiensis TaxID=1441095 RepID=UPI003D24642C
MATHYDAAIIGGGIIGLSTAYHLAKKNVKVALFESGKVGKKASQAAAGMLGAHAELEKPGVFFDFARASQSRYPTLAEEVKEISGIDMNLKTGGILKLAYSKEDIESGNQMNRLDSVVWKSKEEALAMEPSISESILGASFIEDDIQVEPTKVCKAFAKSARLLGADIYEYTPITAIDTDSAAITIKSQNETFSADQLIVASGVWSGHFFQQLGLEKKLYPVKGECLSVWNEDIALERTLYHEHCYIVPRKNGRLVIGATMKPGDWDEEPTLGGIEAVIKKAASMLPAVTRMKIDTFWAGLRPETEDSTPYIGKHPNDNRILFAAGHYRNGILLAPATGSMISDLVLGKKVNQEWEDAFAIKDKERQVI